MDEPSANSEQDRLRAAELAAAARHLAMEGDYTGALEKYEQSIRLHDDESVRQAYFKLLAMVGPL